MANQTTTSSNSNKNAAAVIGGTSSPYMGPVNLETRPL